MPNMRRGVEKMSSIYETIVHKAKNEINSLTFEEKEKAIELLMNMYSDDITHLTDEGILQEMTDKGLIL